MARVEALSLRGIRSFGNDEKDMQVIKFDSPLTLILGQNGCGKTTIIETLKYLCTGEMPFGKGPNFVRDPKLDNNTECVAQVKLKMTDVRGKTLVATKILQTVQKQKKLEFKTVDSTLLTTDDKGKEAAMSLRCANIDEYMGLAFGVSKAILNNVVFCHQEDSFWPLDEGKKLKEKFDEIFEATRYNKFHVFIRNSRKKISENVKECKIQSKFLKENAEMAASKRLELEGVIKRYDTAKSNIEKYGADKAKLENDYSVWFAKERNYSNIHTNRETKKALLLNLSEQEEKIRQNLKYEFSGTQYELEDEIANFSKQLVERQQSLHSVNRHIESLKTKLVAVQQSVVKCQGEIGELQAAEKSQKDRCDQRNARLSQLAQELKLKSLSDSPADEEVQNLKSQVERELQELRNSLEVARQKHETREKKLQEEVDSCRDAKIKLDHDLQSKESSIGKIRTELREVSIKMGEVDSSTNRLQRVETQLKRHREDLEEIKKDEDVEDLQKQIAEHRDLCASLESKIRNLTDEVRETQQYSSIQKELEMHTEKKDDLRVAIRRLRSKHEEAIGRLLKNTPDNSIKFELEELLEKLKRDIQQLNQQIAEKERDISGLEIQRKHKNGDLRKCEEELRQNDDAIYDMCKRAEFPKMLEECQEQIQSLLDEKSQFSASELLFKKYICTLKAEPCCPLCHRDFKNQREAAELVEDLESKVSVMPKRMEEFNSKLASLKEKQNKLIDLKPKHQRSSILRSIEIPKLKEELANMEEDLESNQQELQLLKASLIVPFEQENLAKSMHPDVIVLDQKQGDLRKTERDIESLQSRLPEGGLKRNLDAAIADQQNAQDELSNVRSSKESLERRLNQHNLRVNQLNQQINELVAEQLRIQGLVQQRVQFLERKEELSSLELAMESERADLQKDVAPVKARLDEAIKSLNTAKNDNRRNFESMRTEAQKKKSVYERVQSLEQDIQEYKRQGTEKRLSEVKERLQRLETDQAEVKNKNERLTDEKTRIIEDIASHEMKERELKDNLTLMQKIDERLKLQEEIDALARELGNMNYREIKHHIDEITQKIDEIKTQKSKAEGSLRELAENVKSREDELNHSKFKDAGKKYEEKLASLKILELTEEDLATFTRAFDWSMKYFHKKRMNNINRIIRELWRQIYRGNDIDYIEIQTDESELTGAEKRQIYNYRVVQVKSGVALDMRGRCSAGQKVLACLIIRMALAETFSTNCGILTLDEPTTNLDRSNIISLSNALLEVVRDRIIRKNFQLIVITHDYDFLERMSHAEFLSHYYEVSRNAQSKSQICKKSITSA